jgi:hypothetical protein
MSPSRAQTQKSINQLAAFANRFECLYICPSRTNKCPPISLGLTKEDTPVTPSSPSKAPSVHNELNRLASKTLQFGFIYPDTRDIFHSRDRSFFVSRSSKRQVMETQQADLACLKELNRLAKIVEVSKLGSQTPIYPAYQSKLSSFGRCARKNYGSRNFPNPYETNLRHRLNLNKETRFIDAFPATSTPKVEVLNGAPIIEKTRFNQLLALKANTAMQTLGVTHLPKDVLKHIIQWIRTILLGLIKSGKKKQPTKPVSIPTKEFVPAAEPSESSNDTPAKTIVPAQIIPLGLKADDLLPADSAPTVPTASVTFTAQQYSTPRITVVPPPSPIEIDFMDIREQRIDLKKMILRHQFGIPVLDLSLIMLGPITFQHRALNYAMLVLSPANIEWYFNANTATRPISSDTWIAFLLQIDLILAELLQF